MALERWSKLASTHPRGHGHSAHCRKSGSQAPQPFCSASFSLVLPFFFFFFFFVPPKMLGEGQGGKICFHLVSESWNKTSVFPKHSGDCPHQDREREIHSKRFRVSPGWGLVLTTTISHLGPFPGPEWGPSHCQAPLAPKWQQNGPRQIMEAPAGNPTAFDICGAS